MAGGGRGGESETAADYAEEGGGEAGHGGGSGTWAAAASTGSAAARYSGRGARTYRASGVWATRGQRRPAQRVSTRGGRTAAGSDSSGTADSERHRSSGAVDAVVVIAHARGAA